MIPRQDLVILLLFFLSSLLAVWILFRFLKAEAETRPLRLSGSLPGFILVFGILYLSYWRLFEKGYAPAVILIVFHFLSLFGSWLLFRKLRSTARVVVDRFSLAELLGEHATGKFRIGGGSRATSFFTCCCTRGTTIRWTTRFGFSTHGKAKLLVPRR